MVDLRLLMKHFRHNRFPTRTANRTYKSNLFTLRQFDALALVYFYADKIF